MSNNWQKHTCDALFSRHMCPLLFCCELRQWKTYTSQVVITNLQLHNYTRRIWSQFQCRPLATAGKVSAELMDQKRHFFGSNLGPFSRHSINRDFFKGYTAMRPPSLYWTA